MTATTTLSPASIAFRSLATVAGLATIHAFVGGRIFRKKSNGSQGKQSKGESDDGYVTDDTEETKESETSDQ